MMRIINLILIHLRYTSLSLILEVRCSTRQPHVYRFSIYWGQIITLDQTVGYSCQRGYKSPDGRNLATCTRKGWRPDPLCQGIVKLCFLHIHFDIYSMEYSTKKRNLMFKLISLFLFVNIHSIWILCPAGTPYAIYNIIKTFKTYLYNQKENTSYDEYFGTSFSFYLYVT